MLAKQLLEKALKSESTVQHGREEDIKIFELYLEKINEFIKNKNITISKKRRYKFRHLSKEIEFYKNNDLFLNYCFNCYRCSSGFQDNIIPPFIDNISKNSDEMLKYGSFSKKVFYCIKILNQIMEDYSTSRYLYFLTKKERLCKNDKLTSYVDTLDYTKNSLKYGLLKTIFARLFNILDKIAHLIFYYYDIKKDNIYFQNLVNQEIKELIIKKQDFQLLALYSLSYDMQENGINYHFKKIRNFITHSFLDIKDDVLSSINIINDENYKEHHYSLKLFKEYISELFVIVKAALLYFANALEIESNRLNKQKYIPRLILIKQQKNLDKR